jgi:hypothetical protein
MASMQPCQEHSMFKQFNQAISQLGRGLAGIA